MTSRRTPAWRRDSSGAPRTRSSPRSRWGRCASARGRSTRSGRGRRCCSGRTISRRRSFRAAAARRSRSTWGSASTSAWRAACTAPRHTRSSGSIARRIPVEPVRSTRRFKRRRRAWEWRWRSSHSSPSMTPRGRFLAVRLAYVAIILLATMTQLHFSPDLTAAGQRLARAFTPSPGWRDAIDGLRNTVLFAGLGVAWVLTSLSGRVRVEIERATVVGLGLSVTVEGLQVFSPIRTASMVDVTTSTLGAFAGALVVALFLAVLHRARQARSYLGVPSFLLTGAYTAAVLCEELTPLFRSAPLPGLNGGPLARLRAALGAYGGLLVLWGLRPFLPQTKIGAIAQQLTAAHLVPLASLAQGVDVFSALPVALHVAQQFLLFLPLGCLLAVWPLRLRGRWSHLWPAVWLAAGIEVGHLVIAHRYFDLTNALIACAGLGIGWLALRRSGFPPYGEALAPLRP